MKKVVSATLAGALAVGMVPAMALADDAQLELTAEVVASDAFANGTITAAVDGDGNPLEIKTAADGSKYVEFTYTVGADGRAKQHKVIPTQLTLADGKGTVVDLTATDASGDALYETSNNTVTTVRDKVVKVTSDASTPYAGAENATLTVYNRAAALTSSNVTIFEGEDLEDDDITWRGGSANPLKLGFALNGVELTSGYTVTFVNAADTTDTYTADEIKTANAGKYVAVVTPSGSIYTGRAEIPFEIKPINLSATMIYAADKQVSGAAAGQPLDAYIVVDTYTAGVTANLAIDDLVTTAITSGQSFIAAPGNYTVNVAAVDTPNVADNLTGAGTVSFSVVSELVDDGYSYTDPEGNVVDLDDNDAVLYTFDKSDEDYESFDPKDIEVGDLKYGKDYTVTVTKDGQVVTSYDAAGTYVVKVEVVKDAAFSKGGSKTATFKVVEGAYDEIATSFYFDGAVVTSTTVEPTYDGTDLLDKIEVVIKSGTKTLVEGVDYEIVAKQGTKEITEIVNAGTYTLEIKSLGTLAAPSSDLDKLTVDVQAIAVEAIRIADIARNTLAYTGKEIVPVVEYYSDEDLEAAEAAAAVAGATDATPFIQWSVLPSDVYTVAYTFVAKETPGITKKTTKVEGQGEYEATVNLKNVAPINYTGTGLTDDFVVSDKIGFADVPAGKWYVEPINALANERIMNGVGGNLFKPEQVTNRAMVAAVLYNVSVQDPEKRLTDMSSVSFEEGVMTPFADVAEGAWYAGPIAWAAAAEVVNGWTEGGELVFAPEKDVTREQIACMIVNYMKAIDAYEAVDTAKVLASMPDGAKVSGYAKDSVAWMVANGYMGNGGVINPKATANRAELAGMVYNVFVA